MTYEIYILLLLMTFCGASGGYYFKISSNKIKSIQTLFFNKHLYLGGTFYVIGAGINIYILKYISYNIVLPLNSLTYIWTLIISIIFLKEKVNRNKLIGVFFIVLGVICIAV